MSGEAAPNEIALSAAATAALDVDAIHALRELVGDDHEAIVELVEALLEEAPLRLDELRRGLEDGDPALVERAAHTMKSNGLTFGALELGELCQELELMVRSGGVDHAGPLVERIETEWESVRPALEGLAARGTA